MVKSGRNGLLGSDGPTVRKRRSTPARFGSGRPLGHWATGKEVSSLFFFSFINLFSKTILK
jgi:hypothetical protein